MISATYDPKGRLLGNPLTECYVSATTLSVLVRRTKVHEHRVTLTDKRLQLNFYGINYSSLRVDNHFEREDPAQKVKSSTLSQGLEIKALTHDRFDAQGINFNAGQ